VSSRDPSGAIRGGAGTSLSSHCVRSSIQRCGKNNQADVFYRPTKRRGRQASPGPDATVAGDLGAFVMNMHLIQRIGTGDDIAYLTLYLASDELSWMTGQNLSIDGGVTARYR